MKGLPSGRIKGVTGKLGWPFPQSVFVEKLQKAFALVKNDFAALGKFNRTAIAELLHFALGSNP